MRYSSARKRRRHPHDKGVRYPWLEGIIKELKKKSTWKKHSNPWAKTNAGYRRYCERHFVLKQGSVFMFEEARRAQMFEEMEF